MFPVMQSASRINGVLFLIMMTGMVVYSLPQLWRFATTEKDAASLFLSGELSRKFEKAYDGEFFVRQAAIEAWSNLSYWAFEEGHSGVMIGKEGWLFTNQEYLFPQDLDAAVERELRAVREAAEALRQKGKRLVLLPVPMKVDVYSDYSRHVLTPKTEALHGAFLEALTRNGIEFADVRPAFLAQRHQTPLYLKRDTHWTPQGARLAAQTLAARFPDIVGSTVFTSETIGKSEFKGDLTNYIKVSEWMAPELLATELVDQYQTIAASATEDEAALFGETAVEVALVGSSYTKMDEWNLAGFVKEAIRSDLITVAVEAKGPIAAMEEFFAAGLPEDNDLKTIIWEFPVRSLLSQENSYASWRATVDQLL
ncbi:alginate O-acetyltransferase AlgX-related protein [Allohahella marinimesophila]|uniref:Alginate O-acetyltransferase n=1 Tax=Allohahella marinimesophila TaxID=1054972 RepID=A0ABP7PLR0_9GAMM